MQIANYRIGTGHPAFLLAEVASAHQGQVSKAMEIALAAKKAGAQGIKFQFFRSEKLVAPEDPKRAVFDQIELSHTDWDQVLSYANSLGLPVFADVFDSESLALGKKHEVAAYKIHSTDMENPEFIRAVAASGKPVLLSTGGTWLGTIESAIKAVRAESNEEIMLLYGVQNFPTHVVDSNLRFIQTLKSSFELPVGFLDHVAGGSMMAVVLPALAVAFGADLVEKHLTVERSAKGFDYESSLEQESFKRMVHIVRDAESAFGSSEQAVSEASERYHLSMRRAVLNSVVLEQGIPIGKDQITFVRNKRGISPAQLDSILGRKPVRTIPAWTPLTEDLFE